MTDEKSIEELEAEYLEELDARTKRLEKDRLEFEAQETATKKTEAEIVLKEQWEKDYLEAHPPVTKIPSIGEEPIGGDGTPQEFACHCTGN